MRCSSSRTHDCSIIMNTKQHVDKTVGEVLGSTSCIRETHRLERRGAQSAAATAQAAREAGGLPTKAAKEGSHTRQVFAHAHSGEDGQVLVLLEVRVPHRTTDAERCRGVVQSWSGVLGKLKGGRNPKDGRCLAEPTWRAVGRADVVQVAGVMRLMSWSAMGSGWTSQAQHESHASLQCANVRNFAAPLRSLMQYLSSERHHKKKNRAKHCGNGQLGDRNQRIRLDGAQTKSKRHAESNQAIPCVAAQQR